MSKSKSSFLLLPMVVLVTGLSMTSILQLPHVANSQQNYEKYIVSETDNEQKLMQENTGSGGSTNINCGRNPS